MKRLIKYSKFYESIFTIDKDYEFSRGEMLSNDDFEYLDMAYSIFEDFTLEIREKYYKSYILYGSYFKNRSMHCRKFNNAFIALIKFSKEEMDLILDDVIKFDESFKKVFGDKFIIQYSLSDQLGGVKTEDEQISRFLKSAKTTKKFVDEEIIRLSIIVKIKKK